MSRDGENVRGKDEESCKKLQIGHVFHAVVFLSKSIVVIYYYYMILQIDSFNIESSLNINKLDIKISTSKYGFRFSYK